MRKIKIILFTIVILFTASLLIMLKFFTNNNKVNSSLNDKKILFLHSQTEYFKEYHTTLVLISTIDNCGNVKNFSTEISDDSELFKNIDNPNVLLLMAEEYNDDKKTLLREIPIASLRKVYLSICNIKNKTDYEYSLLTGEDNEKVTSAIYSFNYSDNDKYQIYKLYNANTAASRLKNKNMDNYLDYLFKFFK